jgi:predicted DNA-binding transcriptional regulator YafY
VNRTDRLYAIVEELRAAGPEGRTAQWLADRFEVSSRTIKRDVSALQQGGVPVWATAGPGGGYAIDAEAVLPPLTFTAGEATAIAVALAAQPGLPFGLDGRSALTKLIGAMPESGRRAAADLAERVWVRVPGGDDTAGADDGDDTAGGDDGGDGDGGDGAARHRTPPAPAARRPAVARTLDEAVRRRVVVVIDYTDARGRSTSKRPVEPLAFAQSHGQWYLMAWCRRRRGGRSFRLDRIVGAWPTAERFAERDLADVFDEIPDDATAVGRHLRLH